MALRRRALARWGTQVGSAGRPADSRAGHRGRGAGKGVLWPLLSGVDWGRVCDRSGLRLCENALDVASDRPFQRRPRSRSALSDAVARWWRALPIRGVTVGSLPVPGYGQPFCRRRGHEQRLQDGTLDKLADPVRARLLQATASLKDPDEVPAGGDRRLRVVEPACRTVATAVARVGSRSASAWTTAACRFRLTGPPSPGYIAGIWVRPHPGHPVPP